MTSQGTATSIPRVLSADVQEAMIPAEAAKTQEQSDGMRLLRGLAVLFVYCVHNAWNCWAMLTLAADVPAAESLLGVGETQLGLINTLGIIGVLVLLPIAMVCRWRRALLVVGVVLNLAPTALRYYAGLRGSLALAGVAAVLQGGGYGIIAVWPAIIAVGFFPEARWAVVIAIAGLSNYVGGALGALLTPPLTGGTSDGLLQVLEVEVWVSLGILLLSVFFFWIPDIQEEHTSATFREELTVCRQPVVLTQLVAYGVVIGVSIAIQCTNPIMLEGSGFSTKQAGVCNCVYQLAAAAVGIGLGSIVTERQHLRIVLRNIHLLGFISMAGVLALCVVVRLKGSSATSFAAMLVMQILLGASVMGILPFATQQAVYAGKGASENFVTGFLNVIAMVLSAIVNYAGPAMDALYCAGLLMALVAAEALCFAWLQSWWLAMPASEIGTHLDVDDSAGQVLTTVVD